jgi:peroxisomal 3,2-trans-enoyl-CoA isomerase
MSPETEPNDWIKVEYLGRTAVITLNRPEKLNALPKDGFYNLSQRLREVDTHAEVTTTVLIGKGRFFSACVSKSHPFPDPQNQRFPKLTYIKKTLSGADVSISRQTPPGTDLWRHGLRETVANNLNLTQAFYSHSKILVTALNGPVVGIAAALISFSDFIYCVPHTYLLTPFSSLGLIAEGGASVGFVRRMGIAKANEALLTSRKVPAAELLACGFVNRVFDECGKHEDGRFRELVLGHVEDILGGHLVASSLVETKALIAAPMRRDIDSSVVAELFGGLRRTAEGIPQREFEKIRTGAKRHKL